MRLRPILEVVVVIGVLGLMTDYFFKWSYNRLFPWVREQR